MNTTNLAWHEHRYQVALHALFLGLTLAAGLAVFLIILQPARIQQVQIQLKQAELERLLARANEHRQQHSRLQESVKTLQEQQQALVARIPDVPKEADYLALVTEAANGVGLHVKDYRPGAVAQGPVFSEMTIQLSADGSFEAICQFIDRLENARRLSSIVALQIADKAGDRGYPMDMTVVLYFGHTALAQRESSRG